MIRTRTRLFRHAPRTDLPERLGHHIDQHESASEILVGWVQLAVIVGVSLAYSVVPQANILHGASWTLPSIIATYIAVTLVRLYLAYRRQLPEWLSYGSTVVDVCLPIALVVTAEIPPTRPASLYLAVSTFVYVFAFIALRTLNFDVRKVVTAGLIAVVGWGVLVGYMMAASGGGAMARDAAGQGENPIGALVGAELNITLALIAATAILAVAIARNRRLLAFAVSASDTNAELARFVPAEVADLLENAETRVRAGTAEMLEATVIFLDLEEFTALTERLQPDQLVRTLNAFYAAVAGELTRYDGVVMQFMGDGVLAAFNAPRPNRDHAANALRAAMDIQALLERTTFEDEFRLHARMGINTGTVVHGMLGTPDRLGYTVIGDEVNIAARLEELNKEYGTTIMVTDQTRVAAGADRFDFKLVDEVQLRGRTRATRIYTVDAARRPPAERRAGNQAAE